MANLAKGLGTAASGAALGTAIAPGIGTAIGGVAGGLIGLFGGGDDDSSKQYMDQAIQQLIAVHVPDPAQQQIELQHYYSTGQLSPKLEQTVKQDPSALQQIVQNTQYKQAQDRALSQMQDLGDNGGMNLSDKANLQEQLLTSANKDKSNRDAITDEMARRGQGGSGMALQAQLQGAQAAGDRDSKDRLSVLGSAQDRALKSIEEGGQLAGQMGQQDYQRQADKAAAQDRINQFNTTNAQGVQQRNVASGNASQAYNLDRSQKIANENTDLSNQQEVYNKGLAQKSFEDQMQKANGVAGAYKSAAGNAQEDTNRANQEFGGAVSAVGQLGTNIAANNRWDDFMKKWKTPAAGGAV